VSPHATSDDTSRLPVLDAARGVALLGIFLINLGAFTGYLWLTPEARAALPTARVDPAAGFLLLWLAMGKFYSLFSLLFGLGFALQMDGAQRRGDVGLRRFRRRLLILLAFGGIHLVFWEGDILALYALLGFALIAVRDWNGRALLRASAILLVLPVLLAALIYLTGGAADPGAPLLAAARHVDAWAGIPENAQPLDILPAANWGTYVRYQLAGPLFRYADLLSTGRPFKVLAMFLIGLAIGRSDLLRNPQAWTAVLRRVRTTGLAVGLPMSAVHALLFRAGTASDSPLAIVQAAAYAAGIAPLALAYGAILLLLWQDARWRERLARCAPAGRMALTNYLAQTAVGVLTFYGVGLGLMGRVGPALWVVFAFAVFAAQVAASGWWLTRFRYGPLEWIWRQATYGERLRLRRAAGAEGPPAAAM